MGDGDSDLCWGGALAVGLVARGGTSEPDAAPAGARAGAVALEANASPARALVRVAFNRALKRAILVDARGLSLYAITYDDDGKPACYVDPGFKVSRRGRPASTIANTTAPSSGRR